MDQRRELDGIFGALEKANLAVMDCRAAFTDLFIDYFAEIDLPAVLSALGTALTLIMPVNHESDSADQIQHLVDQFGKQCSYVGESPRRFRIYFCVSFAILSAPSQ